MSHPVKVHPIKSKFTLSCTASVRISADCGEVFLKYSKLENLATFMNGIVELKILTTGKIGLGTRFIHSRVLFGLPVSREVEITSWNPSSLFTASFSVLGIPVDAVHDICECGGGSKVSFTLKACPSGMYWAIAFPMWLLLSKAIRDGITDELNDLAGQFTGVEDLPMTRVMS